MLNAVRLYGLVVRSEIPLHQTRFVTGTAVDLDITVGDGIAMISSVPPGRILLNLQGNRQYYTATEDSNGYHLRFYGTCDVVVNPDLTRATVHIVEGADENVVSVLLAGTVLAFVLAMRGETVLHASAVETAVGALAFAGASGMGKSTTATLMCADGARVITDDLLRLKLTAGRPKCALGATELRLRKGAAELMAQFADGPGRRRTADDRDALAVATSDTEDLPLAAIVVPLPDRSPERTRVQVDHLDQKAALLLLSRFPRLLGWQDKEVLRRQFEQLSEIACRVPIYLAVLPWGPPFRADVAEQILRAVGMDDDAHREAVTSSTPSDR